MQPNETTPDDLPPLADLSLADLSLVEKASLTAGADVWTVPGIERIGLPPLRMTDGPNGARGTQFAGTDVRSIALPCGSALAATFDPALVQRLGALAGREARQKRSRVLLAPTINLVRSPLYGRSFECYGEDPWLSGRLAAAFVTGAQSEGVSTTPKHLIGNETEHERQTIDSVIDSRTLREVYLVPFEWAIRHGGALGLMTSYNRLNGTYCSEDPGLLADIVRGEWGFEGFVVSDWFAAGDTVKSLRAGLDIQMPGPDRFYGGPVVTAIEAGHAELRDLDAIVNRRLHVHRSLDAWQDDTTEPESGHEYLADRELVHEAAAAAMVLCSNDDLLPLDADIASLALIGPNATVGHIMGGGSAQIAAHRRPSPADALAERLGERLVVEPGCVIDKMAPILQPDSGFDVEFFAADAIDGQGQIASGSTPLGVSHRSSGMAIWAGEPIDDLGAAPFAARLRCRLTATQTGNHRFTLVQTGAARMLIDGRVVIDGFADRPPPGEAFFGYGSIEMVADIAIEADQVIEIVIEMVVGSGTGIRGVRAGCQPPVPTDLIARAAAAAAASEVAVVVVGTSAEWETEGVDRASLELPGDQRLLIEAVCEANPNTVVVVNAGAPVDMEWADRPAATLIGWLGGQEMAPALAEVLFGDREPGGRLPVTIPKRIEHTPAFGNFPGESNRTHYGEGPLIGYRWYDSRHLPVRFPFGHGLGYTTFDWSEPRLALTRPGATYGQIEIDLTNTGTRAGSDVVQLYLAPPAGVLFKPARVLVGAAKVHLEPGATTTARIDIGPRTFAHWDPANREHLQVRERLGEAAADLPPRRGSSDATEPGWYIDAGEYRFELARSIEQVVHTIDHVVAEPIGPLTAQESLP